MLRSTFSDPGELGSTPIFFIFVLLFALSRLMYGGLGWEKGRDLIHGVGTGVEMLYSAYLLAMKPW